MASTSDHDVSLSKSARVVVQRYLDELKRQNAQFDEACIRGVIDTTTYDSLDPEEKERADWEGARQDARDLIGPVLTGLSRAWLPLPVMGWLDVETALIPLFQHGNIPSVEQLEEQIHAQLRDELRTISIRIELSLGCEDSFKDATQGIVRDLLLAKVESLGSYHRSFAREFGVTGIDIRPITGPSATDGVFEVIVSARVTPAARAELAENLIFVLQACVAVCEGRDAARYRPVPLNISRREPRAPEEDAFILCFHGLSDPCDWLLLQYLGTTALSPGVFSSEGEGEYRLTAESVVKTGVWTLDEWVRRPLSSWALPSYWSVFAQCARLLTRSDAHERDNAYNVSNWIGLESVEGEALRQLYKRRNHALHQLDTRVLPLESLVGWLLARCALYRLAIKMFPEGSPGEYYRTAPGRAPRRRPTFVGDVQTILRNLFIPP